MAERERLQLAEGSIHKDSCTNVKGTWAELIKSRFKDCRILAYAKPKHYYKGGYYTIYWLDDMHNVGVLDPDGACWICPVTPLHFSSMKVWLPALVADAKAGIFPKLKIPEEPKPVTKKQKLSKPRLKVVSTKSKPQRSKLRRR